MTVFEQRYLGTFSIPVPFIVYVVANKYYKNNTDLLSHTWEYDQSYKLNWGFVRRYTCKKCGNMLGICRTGSDGNNKIYTAYTSPGGFEIRIEDCEKIIMEKALK